MRCTSIKKESSSIETALRSIWYFANLLSACLPVIQILLYYTLNNFSCDIHMGIQVLLTRKSHDCV